MLMGKTPIPPAMYGESPYNCLMPTPKTERLDLRLTAEQKDTIVTAAAITGRSVSDFSTQVLTERAQEAILRERQVRVDAEAFGRFTEILDRPARVNEGLTELLSRKPRFID